MYEDEDIETLLKRTFVVGNPFGLWVAKREKNLPSYFTKPEQVEELLGNPSEPQMDLLYFAARGMGKTATAQMFNYMLTKTTKFGPVLVVNFGARHLKQILSQLTGLEQQAGPSHRVQHEWRSCESGLLEAAQASLQVSKTRLREHGVNLENINPNPSNCQSFEVLEQQLRMVGISACYFLIDEIDEISSDTEIIISLTITLLKFLPIIGNDTFNFKVFLPLEFEPHLDGEDFQHYYVHHDRWQQTDLEELLRNRLEFFSGKKFNSLAFISDSAFVNLEVKMCQAVRGSPRNLLILGGLLLQKAKEKKSRITETMFEEAYEILRIRYMEPASQRAIRALGRKFRLKTSDRHKLIDILTRLDDFMLEPRPALIALGLPDEYVYTLNLSIQGNRSLATKIITIIEKYRQPIEPYTYALTALTDYLLESGLDREDSQFLRELRKLLPD
jgi:hypothetical protein